MNSDALGRQRCCQRSPRNRYQFTERTDEIVFRRRGKIRRGPKRRVQETRCRRQGGPGQEFSANSGINIFRIRFFFLPGYYYLGTGLKPFVDVHVFMNILVNLHDIAHVHGAIDFLRYKTRSVVAKVENR